MFVKFDPIVNYELNIAVQIFYDVSYPKYFRVYNSANLSKATKMTRIEFDHPCYITNQEPNIWKLNPKEILRLIKFLKMPYVWKMLIANWNDACDITNQPAMKIRKRKFKIPNYNVIDEKFDSPYSSGAVIIADGIDMSVQIYCDIESSFNYRVYNNKEYYNATKMARLRFDCERYVDTETPDQWKLSKDELKLLMKLLLTEFEGIAMWRWLVLSYRIETSCVGEPPRLPENTVMPNYLELCL